ncbi:hypothetical protein BBJ28_00002330 [Nothophytophthora sp. Chile5]|nr:hypothetical protein BBJ28_00002330 [Nothophytophthora sp. Chile5]
MLTDAGWPASALKFSDFDTSGDGSIAASELVVLMKSMGIQATLDEELIDKVDDNRSGELEYPEFVRWRMRRLLGEVKRLLVMPDEGLMDEFEAETAQMLHGGTASVRSATAAIIASSTAKAARHPRVITLQCIATYRDDPGAFCRVAQELTRQ